MKRGDIVLVDWPYSDRTGSKARPAVVVQADFLLGILDDTVLIHITSKKHGIPGTEVEIDPSVETASGLLRTSYAFCPNLLTTDVVFIDSIIGVLSDQIMHEIEDCLKVTLGIP